MSCVLSRVRGMYGVRGLYGGQVHHGVACEKWHMQTKQFVLRFAVAFVYLQQMSWLCHPRGRGRKLHAIRGDIALMS